LKSLNRGNSTNKAAADGLVLFINCRRNPTVAIISSFIVDLFELLADIFFIFATSATYCSFSSPSSTNTSIFGFFDPFVRRNVRNLFWMEPEAPYDGSKNDSCKIQNSKKKYFKSTYKIWLTYWSSAGFFVKIYGYVCKIDFAQFVFWTAVGFQPHSFTRSSTIRRTKNVNWFAFNGTGVVEFNARNNSSVVGFTGITLLMAIISSYLLVGWWHALSILLN
jgi:hypothetical protein